MRASFDDPGQADIWAHEATSNPVRWWQSWSDEFPTVKKLALKLLSLLPPSAASAERNWSTQDFIASKRRNRLKARRAEKLIYIYFNLRSLAPRWRRVGVDPGSPTRRSNAGTPRSPCTPTSAGRRRPTVSTCSSGTPTMTPTMQSLTACTATRCAAMRYGRGC